MERQCGTCKFLHEVSKGVRGECRRHAPRPGGATGEAVWPSVGLTGLSAWCGEWGANSEPLTEAFDKVLGRGGGTESQEIPAEDIRGLRVTSGPGHGLVPRRRKAENSDLA